MQNKDKNISELAKNKKAFHDFSILDTLEAGIELKGTEVKSCRAKNITMSDSHVKIHGSEAFLYNVHIAPYECGNIHNHPPLRTRRLLLHRREIRKLTQALREKGCTIIPLKFYLKDGRVKVEIAVAKGKTHGDKRETLRRRQHDLETRKAVSSARRR